MSASNLKRVRFEVPWESRGTRRSATMEILIEFLEGFPKEGGDYLLPEGVDPWDLLRKLGKLQDEEFRRGAQYGTSLLMRLNDGSLSLDDFNHGKEGR